MKICLFSLSDALSPDVCLPFGEAERERLLAIRKEERRQESLGALAALWTLVGEDALPILRTPDGKPYFEASGAPAFSLSHTDGWAAAVLGDEHSGAVGIDIELLRPYPKASQIAARFFTEREARELAAHGESELGFFQLWTRKEAVAKMKGRGLLSETFSEPALLSTFRLTSEKETLLLSVSAEGMADSVSFCSPSEDFQQFHIEELR